MLAVITKVFGNNKFLPQSSFTVRHPKKNHPVTLCQLSSRLHQEPLFTPQSIIHVGGSAGLQSLSNSRHFSESPLNPPQHMDLQSNEVGALSGEYPRLCLIQLKKCMAPLRQGVKVALPSPQT